MLNISIKATNMTLTDAIRSYAEDKVRMLGKFLDENEKDTLIEIELGQVSKHHHAGSIFRAEMTISGPHVHVRVETEKEDLYAAIDIAKDEAMNEIHKDKTKHITLVRKGGRMFKDIMRKIGFGE